MGSCRYRACPLSQEVLLDRAGLEAASGGVLSSAHPLSSLVALLIHLEILLGLMSSTYS